jgi:hypothetical protein
MANPQGKGPMRGLLNSINGIALRKLELGKFNITFEEIKQFTEDSARKDLEHLSFFRNSLDMPDHGHTASNAVAWTEVLELFKGLDNLKRTKFSNILDDSAQIVYLDKGNDIFENEFVIEGTLDEMDGLLEEYKSKLSFTRVTAMESNSESEDDDGGEDGERG